MNIDQLEQSAIDTSSEEVRRAVEYIITDMEDIEQTITDPTISFALYQFGQTPSQEHLKEWLDSDIHIKVYEKPLNIILVLKLLNGGHDDINEDIHDSIERMVSILKSEQSVNGDFALSHGFAGLPLWLLANADPECQAVQRTIEYIRNNPYDGVEYSSSRSDAAAAIIGLSELGHHEYKKTIERIANTLSSGIEKHWNKITPLPEFNTWTQAMALNRVDDQLDIKKIENNLLENQGKDGSWDKSIRNTSDAILSLIPFGHGPKIPKYEAKLKIEKEKQKRQREIPKLVRTVPIDPTASYHAEIQKEAEELIKSASDQLRINSLYIDMLYETIIDKKVANPDLDIRIITRGRDLSGNRKRIKKDVLNDLIEATNGSVKSNRRVHSRMIISDQDTVLISSADLTRDQLRDEFNAGILTHEDTTIDKSIQYFDNIWQRSEKIDQS